MFSKVTMSTQPLNELDRLVVDFAPLLKASDWQSAYPIDQRSNLFIALETTGEADAVWRTIDDLQASYINFGTLCSKRARMAEKGELLLNTRRVHAEVYLKAWRKAEANAIPIGQFLDRGMTPVVTISRPAAISSLPETARYNPEFLEALKSCFVTHADSETITWTIPLTDFTSLMTYRNVFKLWLDPKQYSTERYPCRGTYSIKHGRIAPSLPIPSPTSGLLQGETADLFEVMA